MNTMKLFYLLPFLLIFSCAYGQNTKALKLFNKGKIAFESKDYLKAESFLQKSIKKSASDLAYYYLGMTQLILDDTCSACNCLLNAKIRGNSDATILFSNECVQCDTINYRGGSYFCVVTKWTCTNELEAEFFKRSKKIGSDTMVFLENDSAINSFLFYSSEFEIEKYLDKTTPGIVPEVPEFPGGESGLMDFLRDNIKYPAYAREKNIQGTVFVRFVIQKDGKVSLVRVLKGAGGGLDEEAIRVIKAMPNWKPGIKDGKPVNIIYNIPIRFILAG